MDLTKLGVSIKKKKNDPDSGLKLHMDLTFLQSEETKTPNCLFWWSR